MRMTLSIVAFTACAAAATGAQGPKGWDRTALRAAQLMADGKAEQAIPLLETSLAQAPQFEAAQYELGKAHHMRGEALAVDARARDASRTHFQHAAKVLEEVARRNGQYRQAALGRLLTVYDADELDRPVELADAARRYVAIDPGSLMGHVALATALLRSGRDADAWAALDAACGAVDEADGPGLARAILMRLTEALPFDGAAAPGVGAAASRIGPRELGRLLDYADRTLDRELAGSAPERGALLAKAAAVTLRAQRLERDPARRKALEAEAEALLARNRERNGAPTPPPLPDGRPETPPGFQDAAQRAHGLIAARQYAEAAAVFEPFIASHPAFVPPHYQRIDALIRGGRGAEVDAALRAARQAIPATYQSRYDSAVYIEELVRKNPSIAAADAIRVLTEARALIDDALAQRPNEMAALVYKSLVLRGVAKVTADPAAAKILTAEADRVLAAAKAQQKP